MNQEQRHIGVADDVFRHAAGEYLPQSAVAVAAQHQQIRATRRSAFQKRLPYRLRAGLD